jgi:hypothetical protein
MGQNLLLSLGREIQKRERGPGRGGSLVAGSLRNHDV